MGKAREKILFYGGKKMNKKELKELKQSIEQKLGFKIIIRPNKSYNAIWAKIKKEEHLIFCHFIGKKKERLCLPWSVFDLSNNDNLQAIVNEYLEFKKSNSVSKNIKALEKALKEKGLI